MAEFYQQLKKAMTIKNITQAELCKITGIPKSAMSQYVSGKFVPKQTRTYLIAKALHVNEAWLMDFDEVPMDKFPVVTDETALEQIIPSLPLTAHENKLITAYREKAEMQPAVDKLLGIESETELIPSLVAARSKNNDEPIHIELLPDLSKFPKNDTDL